MNLELLKPALDALSIQRIILRDGEIKVGENIEMGFFEGRFVNQLKRGVTGIKKLEGFDEDDNSAPYYRYIIEFGARLIQVDESGKFDEQKINVPFEIIARFNVDYLTRADLSNECLAEFSQNAIHNAWPYWREYVQSTCARCGVPQIEIPPFTLPKL